MKNRFYGDVNDYIKYGILDILSEDYKAIGINWYLTDDRHGNQNHGNVMRHIEKEEKWKDYNPRIFSLLKKRVQAEADERKIKYCKEDKVFDFKYEFCDQLPDNVAQKEYKSLRNRWHSRAITCLRGCDLVFFDPDIGVIDQLSKGVVKDSEYCLVQEIEDYDWCDWLIVQFPRRSKRFPALRDNPIVKSTEYQKKKVMVFLYGAMALLYISKTLQAKILSRVFEEWDTKIQTKILIP